MADQQPETERPKQDLPTVRVVPMTIGRPSDAEPVEWFACCTDAVWLRPENRDSDDHFKSCNWYGEYRDTIREARADAARHRRAHKVIYSPVSHTSGGDA